MTKRLLVALLLVLCTATLVQAQTKTIIDADIVGTYNFSSDTTYILDGFVFVEPGETITAGPGTVFKGKSVPTTGDFASALIIARGGYADLQGSSTDPIIFTGESDDVTDPNDLDPFVQGLWGGVIILGAAPYNCGPGQVEGVPQDTYGTLGYYGQFDGFTDTTCCDNSGIYRYISIRHGGAELSDANEVNGLTMGGVGAGTVIEYIEVWSNLDDGFEWFGGSVFAKYLTAGFVDDDSFDYDEGFNGGGQYWFTIQSPFFGDSGGEHDGGNSPDDCPPFATPCFSNLTYMGAGFDNSATANNPQVFNIRDNAGGKFYNSIFTDHANNGVKIEDLGSGSDSRERLETCDLQFKHNTWYGFGAGNTETAIWDALNGGSWVSDYMNDNKNEIFNPEIRSISRTPGSGLLDPRPRVDGSVIQVPTDEVCLTGQSFDEVKFRGAFDPCAEGTWLEGWTALDEYGFLGTATFPPTGNVITLTDASLVDSLFLSNDNEYLIDGFLFVAQDEVLTIEAGTVIRGKSVPTTGDFASALIVSRGGLISAVGCDSAPIIFTGEGDDVTDNTDIDPFVQGLWGGVIVLGAAPYNCGPGQIEGIPQDTYGTLGFYGQFDGFADTNSCDNSGSLKYVSIRHGGAELSDANEINGLTMGGLGAQTFIEYVEVWSNLDDGFEWFGGAVRCNHLVAGFVDDDSFDYDEGFRGGGQFWFTIQSPFYGDNGGEHDGGNSPDDCPPFAIPVISNVTYLGAGDENQATANNPTVFNIRDNAGGYYINSIFADHANNGLIIEDKGAGSSRERLDVGDLRFECNSWYGFGAGNTAFDIWDALNTTAPGNWVSTYMLANNNDISDPSFISVNECSRTPYAGSLDPRPTADVSDVCNFYDFLVDCEACTYGTCVCADDPGELSPWTAVSYRGAFDPTEELWVNGWTALDHYGFIGSNPCGSGCCDTPGDANDDGGVNVGDGVYIINFVFKGGPAPVCPQEGDANADGGINVGDGVYIINFVFKGGPAPVCGP